MQVLRVTLPQAIQTLNYTMPDELCFTPSYVSVGLLKKARSYFMPNVERDFDGKLPMYPFNTQKIKVVTHGFVHETSKEPIWFAQPGQVVDKPSFLCAYVLREDSQFFKLNGKTINEYLDLREGRSVLPRASDSLEVLEARFEKLKMYAEVLALV